MYNWQQGLLVLTQQKSRECWTLQSKKGPAGPNGPRIFLIKTPEDMPYAYFFYNFWFYAGPSGSMKGPAGPTGSGSAYFSLWGTQKIGILMHMIWDFRIFIEPSESKRGPISPYKK